MENQNYTPTQYQDNEIDLFELVAALWSRRWLIVGITVASIALAVIYLLIAPKIYEAKILISETQSADVAQLNVGEDLLGQYAQSVTSLSAYNLFQKNMQSRKLAMGYFKGHVEPNYRESGSTASVNALLDEVFLKSISVAKPGKNSDYLTITHQYTESALAAEWLNGYVRYVEQETKKELIKAAELNKALAIKGYEKEVASLRVIYSRVLKDDIARLEEAYKIAKKLNFKPPFSKESLASSWDESPLYMKGYDVLGAEIESLKSRELVDPFIPRIRPIQEKLNYLESVVYDAVSLDVIAIDAWAAEPERSIKPRKALVLMLAGFMGGVLGVVVALFLRVIEKRKTV